MKRETLDIGVMRNGIALEIEQQLKLITPFEDRDIKKAMFSIHSVKSPGPGGYSSSFFKAGWSEIGSKVCKAVTEFFSLGEMLKEWNETKMMLIPKVDNPIYATDFRPISCYNVIYKFISKLLCTRLKEVLPHIINQC